MKDINEYNNNTSDYELFAFLYERIFNGEIRTFSNLKDFVEPIIKQKRTHNVIMQAFGLIKRLYWGFFMRISPQTHLKLWKELVISDRDFPNAGDIKRTLQISNLYICMLDIHGYTKFCMDSRKNLSMMHILDRAIEYDAGRIATACGAICQRERGDEMVILAATASDAIAVTLGIIDYFGKTNVLSDPHVFTGRSGEASALPVFKITAGITGGNTTSPLIITEKGQLSGFLLNSGARLQTRANELSPNESRIMIARQVQMNFLKEIESSKGGLANNRSLFFFDTGHIEFKGVMIPACEVVFYDEQRYKEKYSREMAVLLGSIRDNLWEQRIFCDIADLTAKAALVMPKFSINPPTKIDEIQLISNESLVHLCHKAITAYLRDEDYPQAVTILNQITEIAKTIPDFDRLILDYLIGISQKYTMLLTSYKNSIDEQVEAKASDIYQGNYYQAWIAAKKNVSLYNKLYDMGRRSTVITQKKKLWFYLIKQNDMEFVLHSGKK